MVLVAQDSTNYGRDWGERDGLADLLRAMTDAYPDLPWIRVMYAYPSHVTQSFLDVMAERPQICKYFDMPLQHTHPGDAAADAPPAPPGRRADRLDSRSVVPGRDGADDVHHRLPRRDRGRASSTSSARSRRSGSGGSASSSTRTKRARPRSSTPNRIAQSVKMRRRHELMAAARAASHRANEALVGTVQEVLIEGEGELDGRAVPGRAEPPRRARGGRRGLRGRARARSARSSSAGHRRARLRPGRRAGWRLQ